MKQYTTPLETLIVPIDITMNNDIWVYLSRGNEAVEKTNEDISVELTEDGKTKIELALSQEETAKLSKGAIKVEVTWKNRTSGYVGKTETAIINGNQSLKKGVV